MTVTDEERRQAAMRGASVAACALAVSVAMPAISDANSVKREEADARLRMTLFAQTGDGGEANRALPSAPAIIQHPWLVRVEHSFERSGLSELGRYAARDRDLAALASVASFEPAHLSRAETISAEHECMSEAVYYEARSEDLDGQLAVAEVIANRVRDHRFPNSVCEVVYQGATRTTGCQFTFTCDGSMALRPRGVKWEQAKAIAAQVMMNVHEPRTGEATHYHATYVNPVWNSGLVRTERIGAHIFYRFPQGREWAAARARQEARLASLNTERMRTVSADAEASSRELEVIERVSASAPASTAAAAP